MFESPINSVKYKPYLRNILKRKITGSPLDLSIPQEKKTTRVIDYFLNLLLPHFIIKKYTLNIYFNFGTKCQN